MAMTAPHAARHGYCFSTADNVGRLFIGVTVEPLDRSLAERHQELAAVLTFQPTGCSISSRKTCNLVLGGGTENKLNMGALCRLKLLYNFHNSDRGQT